ncbi:hypothetical protein HYV57_05250 [Candidatus Peregrinibacteria bacterium]|nr:hypothetical protein [Candidatus Peregrinibacteria bacterium]
MKHFFLNRILNVTDDEWPRIVISWTLRFLFQLGFVIGWTIVLSMFVSRIGLRYLPYLFLANAALIMSGTFLYSEIIHRVKKETLIVFTALASGFILYFSTFFPSYNHFIFFGFVLIAGSILLSQLDIIISLFIEDLFSPMESERTFPIIESSHTIGGIVAGLIVSAFANYLPPWKFIYIWVISVLLIIPVMFAFQSYAKKVPFLEFKKKYRKVVGRFKKMMEGYSQMKIIPFLKGLIVIIVLQWIFINLLEFQYINAIQKSIANLSADNESSLAKKLGFLHMLFFASALTVQLLMASRIIKALGIVGSLILEPLVMLVNVILLMIRFNALSAIMTKVSFEITHIIYQNAYLSSFYTIESNIRENAREFMEGIIKPLGAIIGMVIILNLQNFLLDETLSFSINSIMAISLFIILLILWNIKTKYTLEATNILQKDGKHFEKYTALEVLSQKGHANAAQIIVKRLIDPYEDEKIKIKTLQMLGKLQDPTTIPEILDCLSESSEKIKLHALEALSEFRNLGKHVFSQAFSKYRVINTLKKLFFNENSEEIHSYIIQILANLKQSEIADFIIQTLKTAKSDRIKRDCIEACGLFHDPNAAHYIEVYLNAENPEILEKTIVSLWHFPKYQHRAEKKLETMLKSNDNQTIKAGINALGELNEKSYIPFLVEMLKNDELKTNAIFALAKLGHETCHELLLPLLMEGEKTLVEKTRTLIKTLPQKMKKNIEKELHRKVSEEMNEILNNSEEKSLETIDEMTLKRLRELYELVEEHHEVLKIDQFLSKNAKNRAQKFDNKNTEISAKTVNP